MLVSQLLLVTYSTPALAVIDGTLCQLNRAGSRTSGHLPLATAVVEFRHGPLCVYVREHPYGLLPGISNLYCLDAAFRLQWLAEWPERVGPCTGILQEEAGILLAHSASGATVRLNAHTGRLVEVEDLLAVAS